MIKVASTWIHGASTFNEDLSVRGFIIYREKFLGLRKTIGRGRSTNRVWRTRRRKRVRNTQALTIILLLAQLRRYCFHTRATYHLKRFAAASAIVRVIQPAGFLRSFVH